jgi:broad specificity phosphatase PhoE
LRYLLLIRHSQPEIIEGIPAKEWRLSEEGRRRCKSMAKMVATYVPDTVVTSREPKAFETGQIIAGRLQVPAVVVENLHEHERSKVPFLGCDEFNATVKHFFDHPDQLVLGDETADQAYDRFNVAIQGLLSSHPTTTLAIVAHGTVISLFVARQTGIDAFQLWGQLGMPALLVLSQPEMKIFDSVENVIA